MITKGAFPYETAVQAPSMLLVCRYCKKIGHLLEQCEIRERNNMRADQQGNGRGQPGVGTQAEASAEAYPTLVVDATSKILQR